MLSTVDKALVGFALGFLGTLNQKYGFHFDVGPNTQSVLMSLVDASINGAVGYVMVYLFPNKGTPQ